MGPWTRRELLGIAAVAVLGILRLPAPFTGDQALFTVTAQEFDQGAVFYRDVWDLKQPGIFLFYFLGGKVFGFTEIGIHLFELILLLLFSVFLVSALRKRFVHPGIASLLPLAAVGSYYAVSGEWHLTQVESIVGVPLFLSLWLALEAHRFAPSWRPVAWFASGLLGGWILLLKLMFLPMVALFWLAALVQAVRVRRESIGAVAGKAAVPLAIGVLLPVVAFVAYAAHHGVLPLVTDTFFILPPRIVAVYKGDGVVRLVRAAGWFVIFFAPLTVLGGWRALRLLMRRPFAPRDDALELLLLLWCLSGTAVIVMQRTSWWQYHFMLLVVPLGILMLLEIDERWDRWKASGKVVIPALVILLAPMTFRFAKQTWPLARHGGAIAEAQRLEYRREISQAYRIAYEETRFLREPDSRPGAIYVLFDPLYYYVSGRHQAAGFHGWAVEFYLPDQWTLLTGQLRASRPPYIFVPSGLFQELMERDAPEMTRMIASEYAVLSPTPTGAWHVRKSP